MSDEQPAYFSYLLRLWRVNEADKIIWRASLEDPNTGKRIGFADLKGLFEFLERQVGSDIGREEHSPY